MRRPAMAEAQRLAAAQGSSGAGPFPIQRSAMSRTFRMYGALVTAIIGLVSLGGVLITVVNAATFQGPTAAAPGGNIPVTIWNALSTGGKQENATIDVDGALSLGAQTLDLGVADGGENLMYGFAPYATMHAADTLLLLETESASA
ncbi:MAG TPA: hypothetical protein VI565_05500, partial [Burkholderiales bacterium]|nr:hypothetical protein [Burkholderiales bacterium]